MSLMLPGLTEQLETQRKRVDVDHFDITVRELLRMVDQKELKRAPEYQRKFRWNAVDESRLIESLFLGLPVPSIYVATNSDGTWELVDGLQRISTLIHFALFNKELIPEIQSNECLRLSGLEKLDKLNGITYDELPINIQLILNKRAVRVTALSDKSDPDVRFDVFERLNNGGIALSPQEVRGCVYRGEFTNFINNLATLDVFRKSIKLQKKRQNDGTYEELVLKFFAFLYDRESFKGDVKGFLNNFAKNNKSGFCFSSGKDLFLNVWETISQLHNGPLLRAGANLTSVNQVEGIMVGLAELIRDKQAVCPVDGWINDVELVNASKGATNTRQMLSKRIERARALFAGAVPIFSPIDSGEDIEVEE